MLPTSRFPSKALFACLALALASQFAFADAPGPGFDEKPEASEPPAAEAYAPRRDNEIAVSDSDFNHFIFPAAIVKGPIFPAGAPVLGEPVYLADNTQLLLQLVAGADEPFNMIVELENGQVYKFWLKPLPIRGITKRVENTHRRVSRALDAPLSASARAADVELMKRVVTNTLPEEFQPVPLPAPTHLDKFSVIPLSSWSDGFARRVTMYSLAAAPGQTAVVAAPQFYHPGITAISVDGDVVDVANSPTLYVIEAINE